MDIRGLDSHAIARALLDRPAQPLVAEAIVGSAAGPLLELTDGQLWSEEERDGDRACLVLLFENVV